MLVYDGSGITQGVEIQPKDLRVLATAICEEGTWHHDLPKEPDRRKIAEENYEKQLAANGYCRDCERLAGFILSKFTIGDRP
jgi:hypothetical protein